MHKKKEFESLKSLDTEITLLEQTAALLEWDEETQMPREGVQGRAEQLSLIRGYIYDKKTSSQIEDLSIALQQDDDTCSDVQKAMIRIYRREYEQTIKIPKQLVLDMSDAKSKGQVAWAQARKADDFSQFSSYLERIITLERAYADALGYEEHPYDALLDQYEQGMTTQLVTDVFEPLKKSVSTLLARIVSQPQVDDTFLYESYPKELQDKFGRMVLQNMGFDFSRAHMSESVHPFTTTVGPDDIRITTRYDEPSVSSPLFSTIHEGGHALYELGASNRITRGTVLAQGVSMSVHESQSRLWENIIGRSDEFWHYYYPQMQKIFPSQLADVSQEAFIRGINKVEPSMIRVNADEVSYNLHIILRFELEKALITGDLSVKDLPAAWNDTMKSLIGVVPNSDAEGVLQDVHWSAGLIGYFPTYVLGNLFGAQFYRTMCQQLPNSQDMIARGELQRVGSWLNHNIYQYGSIYPPQDLLMRVTGERLNSSYFITYLTEKYQNLYGLT